MEEGLIFLEGRADYFWWVELIFLEGGLIFLEGRTDISGRGVYVCGG